VHAEVYNETAKALQFRRRLKARAAAKKKTRQIELRGNAARRKRRRSRVKHGPRGTTSPASRSGGLRRTARPTSNTSAIRAWLSFFREQLVSDITFWNRRIFHLADYHETQNDEISLLAQKEKNPSLILMTKMSQQVVFRASPRSSPSNRKFY